MLGTKLSTLLNQSGRSYALRLLIKKELLLHVILIQNLSTYENAPTDVINIKEMYYNSISWRHIAANDIDDMLQGH